jgi:hypothetical protein
MVSFHQPLQWEGGQWLLIDKSGKFLWSQPERSGGKWGAKTD